MQPSTAAPADDGAGRGAGRVSAALGWFSIGLGTAQVLAPTAISRLVGVAPTPRSRTVMRAVGLQELSVGSGILASDSPNGWLWARVAGDVTHLMLLGSALRAPNSRRRVSMAIGAVAGVAVVDLIASVRTARTSDRAGRVMRSTTAITINHPPEDVYRYWRDLDNFQRFMFHLESVEVTADRRSHWVVRGPGGTTVEWDAEIVQDTPGELIAWRSLEGADVDNAGAVHFAPAPGGRGTEVTVELEVATPGGEVGRALAKMVGEHPEQQVKDALRRLKQILEAGEIVRSDSSPDGTRTQQQWRRPAARPPV